jgi:DNA (cytosine-5)-methyltransferase 1
MKPKCLDLFCGAGGATRGYQLAGFEVWGVDSRPQPRYCGDHFTQLNVFALPPWQFDLFDLIHASPPCQAFSALNNGVWGNATGHPDLIEPTRKLLHSTGKPYVIENVPRSPLIDPVTLCGSMFGLRIDEGYLRRHRLFEASFPLPAPPPCEHKGKVIGVYGHGAGGANFRGRSANADQARRLMQMPWSNRDGIAQAIPPAYTEWIGRQAIDVLALQAAA